MKITGTTNLNRWIAQSEAWSLFKSLELSEDSFARYPFLSRTEDFYIYLVGELVDVIGMDFDDTTKAKMLSVAKGLEIYSLNKTAETFSGVNTIRNLIYASALYYLAGYSASSFLIAKSLKVDYLSMSEMEIFLHSFLSRSFVDTNRYSRLLKSYIHFESDTLQDLLQPLNEGFSNTVGSPSDYILNKLTLSVIRRFVSNSTRVVLAEKIVENQPNWEKFIKRNLLLRNPPIWEFFPSQNEAIRNGILSNEVTSLQMPTSAGKTSLCELVIYDHIKNSPNNKVLFLAPFRALALELRSGFGSRLGKLGIKTKTLYGNDSPSPEELGAIDEVDVLIATPEKYRVMQALDPNINNLFNLVICDEGHLIDDESRGMGYELLLTKLKSKKGENYTIRFLYLSAIVPNIEIMNQWLGGTDNTVIKSTYKPTEVEYAFLYGYANGSSKLEVNPIDALPKKYILNNFIVKNDLEYVASETGRKHHYALSSVKRQSVTSALKSLKLGPVALFSTTKGGNMGIFGLAQEMIEQVTLLPALPKPISYVNPEEIKDLQDYFEFLFGKEFLVTKAIGYGIGCHYADLPQCVREEIENALREKKLYIVICTTTLAEGVNLPIKTMIVHSLRRYIGDKKYKSLPVRDIKNITGRVGRAGKETKGLVIISNPEDFRSVVKLMKGNFEEKVYGYLYRLALGIHRAIENDQLVISDDMFQNISERIKGLVDEIDISLLELLSEEINEADLEDIVTKIVSETLAASELEENELQSLKEVFSNRVLKLYGYQQAGDLTKIRKSLSSPRLYFDIMSSLDKSLDVWISPSNLSDVLEAVFDVISKLPEFQHLLLEFNSRNQVELTATIVRDIVQSWLNGLTYIEIAKAGPLDVDLILKVLHDIVDYKLLIYINSIIKILENELTEETGILPEDIINLPHYIRYGIGTSLQMNLFNLGFTDRSVVQYIEHYLLENELDVSTFHKVRQQVLDNSSGILEYLGNNLPKICKIKAATNMDLLEEQNILM